MLYTYLLASRHLSAAVLGGKTRGSGMDTYLLPSPNSIEWYTTDYSCLIPSPIHVLGCVRLPAGKLWPKPATVVWFVLFVICVCV